MALTGLAARGLGPLAGATVDALFPPACPACQGETAAARSLCADCWAEWQNMEVMVINELRLNFMDPKSQDVLDEHMRKFFFLDGGRGDADMPVPEDR